MDVIRSYSFYHCRRLTSVTLGCGVDSIASNTFMGCTSLDTLHCRAVVPPTIARKTAFDSSNYTGAVLMVPQVSLSAYQSAPFWSLFVNVAPLESPYGRADVNGDGEVNIADINALIDVILSLETAPQAADVNFDGEVNIADINALIEFLLPSF